MKHILCAVFFALLLAKTSAIFPNDQITLPSFNRTYYLRDEIYTFDLVRAFQVPVQVLRHKIYTSTTEAIQNGIKRALEDQKRSLQSLSPEDYVTLEEVIGSVPGFVKVDHKKRSLSTLASGFKVIKLTDDHVLLHSSYEDRVSENLKRGLSQEGVSFGSAVCFHIPFFTTCDNSADLKTVKDALQFQVNAIRQELDSYKQTNDARANELAKALNQQRDLISQMAANAQQINNMVAMVSSAVSVNSAQIAHGDYIAQAQINYLKRVTDSLLKYSNSLASSDPRTVVAQPAMSKLFLGYKALLELLGTKGFIPIIDTKTFNFTEQTLPQNTVNNFQPTNGTLVGPGNDYIGFPVYLQGICTENDGLACVPGKVTFTTSGWIYGPFHHNHYGVYPLRKSNNLVPPSYTEMNTTEVRPVVDNSVIAYPSSTNLRCIQFLGYTMLADFDATPYMKNGIEGAAVPLSNCDPHRLVFLQGSILYRMFSINEGVVIPFYSNCALATLRVAYPDISIGYMSHYPDPNVQSTNATNVDKTVLNRDVTTRYFVTQNCYINLEPGWLDMKYFIPNNTDVINNIPRGYKLNQFTINPDGELASSLEFLYTNRWAWAYSILRTSDNNIITSEIDILNNDYVLFDLPDDSPSIIDESDAFFGEGNNGRDCVHRSDSYEYDLLSCFYQNDQKGYTTTQYLGGSIVTSGIARFNNKFSFSLQQNTGNINAPWSFQLIPNGDADFSFYVQTEKSVCPKLISRKETPNGCTFNFVYTGADVVQFNGRTTNTLIFTNYSSSITVPLSNGVNYVLRIGNPAKDCLVVPCTYSYSTSSVQLVTPNIEIYPSSEKNLVTKIAFSINSTIDETVNNMRLIQHNLYVANQNLSRVMDALKTLNFNVTQLVPYKNFTELRKQVDALIAAIPDSNNAGACSSPWNSAECFFQQFGTTLITIAVVLGVIIIGYLVLFKFGLAKKIKNSLSKKSPTIPMATQ